jgi:hypothetical protein
VTPCWNWPGGLDHYGYGQLGPRHLKTRKAHRWAYELFYGLDPGKMCVLHRCDNRACINPAHLFLGTQADNNKDASRKGRSARGEGNGQAKITADDAAAIRCADGTQREIALRFGVSQAVISRIKLRQIWNHI